MFATLEEKFVLIGVAVLLLIGAYGLWQWHERELGAQKCEKADTSAADKQIAAQAAQLKVYETQLGKADALHQTDLSTITALRGNARGHLVCHQTDTSPVPGLPSAPGGQPAASGNTADLREPDFDPAPALADLSAAYERRVETARDALNRWPNAPAL